MAKGARVQYHDPHVQDWRSVPQAVRVDDAAAAVAGADLTILVQNHRGYDVDALAAASRSFFDTRGKAADGEKVHRL
jgi:UDP-N-acetyl-D-mannosaminuronate dehydrogenase